MSSRLARVAWSMASVAPAASRTGGDSGGLYGILVLALLSVFIAGLMVGRTPEFLGKKIRATQMKLVVTYVLTIPVVVLVLGGIHMSPIPEFDYDLLYEERVIRSVANNTRRDGEDFLRVAAEIPIRTEVTLFPLREANRALNDLKADRINGAAVLDCRS